MLKELELEESLPSLSYTSEPFFQAECERILSREWACIGREEDVAKPGDVRRVDFADASVLITRNKAGEIKAFHNVCRHRGTRLCGEDNWGVELPGGATQGGLIRCPYHQWAYDADGNLVAAPGLSDKAGFDKSRFSLYPVPLEFWGGFIFARMKGPADGEATTAFKEALREPSRRLRNYPLEDLRTARTIRYDIAANWKIILENYNECYHCAGVHPELCEIVPDFRDNAGRHIDWEEGAPHRDGAWTYTANGVTARQPFPGLSETEKTRHKGELLYPNLMFSVSADHAAAFLLTPVSFNRTIIDCLFLFHKDEMSKEDFDPADAVDFWDLVNRQDWAVCERVQQGLSSGVHQRGYYAPLEDLSLDIRAYIRGFFSESELETGCKG